MANVELKAVLDGVQEFVADAIVQLETFLGESHPTVQEGRRILAALEAIPDGAVLVTEESLAAALGRVWPIRRNSGTNLALSAATVLAALRTA